MKQFQEEDEGQDEFGRFLKKYLKTGTYLNVWNKIPSYKDFNYGYALLKIFFLLGLGGLFSYLMFKTTGNLGFSVGFGLTLMTIKRRF
jgi:hypothetical protein